MYYLKLHGCITKTAATASSGSNNSTLNLTY